MREVIHARSYEYVRVEHASIFEVTVDDWLIPTGGCIISVKAERTPVDFDPVFVETCQSRDAVIGVHVRVDAGDETHGQAVHARGHPDLTSGGDRSIVFCTSDYVDDRTDTVDAAHAVVNFDRDLVLTLAGGVELTVIIEVEQLGVVGRGVG